MMQWASKYLFYPLWDLKEGAQRLAELNRLEKSQFWPRARLEALQLERLRETVAHAVRTCPYYREHYRDVAPGELSSLADLRRLPTVSKQEVRLHLRDFMSETFRIEALYEARTGGSTGHALTVYFDKRCQEFRNAAAMRSDRWAKRDLGTATAAVWGNPPRDERLKDKIRGALLSRLIYLDTMGLNDDSIRDFVALWRRRRPKVIFGHAHSIFVLARFLRAQGISDVRPQGIITTSMMLLDRERAVIEAVFGCRVSNRYGCEEVGLIAAECPEHGGMHINAEHVLVECLGEDGEPAAPGEEGEVVVTDLINRGMPLIRYKVGDVAVCAAQPCTCGRAAPLLTRVVGRTADFLVKTDGTLVAGVSLVERTLTRIAGLDQMQIVQESLRQIVLNVVPGAGYSAAAGGELVEEFKRVFGQEVAVEVRPVASLAQERSGKYRFSICKAQRP